MRKNTGKIGIFAIRVLLISSALFFVVDASREIGLSGNRFNVFKVFTDVIVAALIMVLSFKWDNESK